MQNEMRNRLIELVKHVPYGVSVGATFEQYFCEKVADHLIENGVIVLPCNVGDTVWEINTDNPFDEDLRVMEAKVERFFIGTSVDLHCMDCVGKTVFLTKEEAEKALKECENNGC